MTCKDMSWVGIPIILAANHLHLYMKQTPFKIPKYSNEYLIKKYQDDESHRKAFAQRINYVFLEGEHT